MMTDNERDTHFAVFAESHYLELSNLFAEMYACKIVNDYSGADENRYHIKALLAQRAYDLVYHTLANTTQAMAAYCEHRPDIPENVLAIPDLTEWPPTEREQEAQSLMLAPHP